MFDDRSVSHGRLSRGPRAGRRTSYGSGRPNNGLLLLGVAASILIMVGLGMLIMTLLGDPGGKSGQNKHAGHSPSNGPFPWSLDPACAGPEEKSGAPPTPMTFYKELTTQERQAPATQETPRESAGPHASPEELPKHANPGHEPIGPPPSGTRVAPMARAPRSIPDYASKGDSIPSEKKSPKTRYAVQVGAYSDPAIAMQWVQRWRKRGFKAALRPVPTPEGRIMYRLQVGEFDSAQHADQLVLQLKKEGISGLRRKVGD